jgi:hypothetical protein
MIPPEAALLCAIGFSCLAFALYRGSVALVWCFVIGYLLLPAEKAIDLPGLPPVDKEMAIWLGATLGTLIFQPRALRRVPWHPADLVVLAILLTTVYTSVINGLGWWDGISGAGRTFFTTVLPYLLARLHLRHAADLVGMATALFWGGLLYVPLAVWEFRMSPQLHATVYGYFPHSFAQHVRWGHFRPVLFVGHGLAVAAYFSSCLLIGFILLKRGLLRVHFSSYARLTVAAVGLGLALTMSVGPWCAAIVGWGAFRLARRWRWAPLVAGFPGIMWLLLVFTAHVDWKWMVSPFEALGAAERAESLEYRLDAMREYSENIRKQPWWGYGGWGRGRIERRATDSAALIYMLEYGFVGAGVRYVWLFLLVLAALQASERASQPVERDVLLLFACLIGITITTSILGTASVFVPEALVGGATTGLVTAGLRPGRNRRGFPAALPHHSAYSSPRPGER